MKYVIWTILMMCLSLAMVGCCERTRDSYPVSCNVEQTSTGATYSCPNGSTASITNGTNGTNGSNGSNGTNGIDGANGTNGTNGTNGQDGAVGATGPQGPQGPQGYSLSFNVTPATATECPSGGSDVTIIGEFSSNTTSVCSGANGSNGSNGTNGTNGTNGSNGSNGTNGTNGTNGVDLTPVTIVQFCSGASSYPSTFPEIGLCIGNNMYGVYSANDGFMAYLPPGGYHSAGINSTCNFTILPNCVVQ